MTTGKIKALTVYTCVSKVMFLVFNILSKFIIASSPKKQLFSNFVAAGTICSDFGAQESKICYCFKFLPVYLLKSHGTRCHDLRFLNVKI